MADKEELMALLLSMGFEPEKIAAAVAHVTALRATNAALKLRYGDPILAS